MSCIICSEPLEDEKIKLNCDCKIFYHRECITGWLKINSSCPTCRKHIAVAFPEKEDCGSFTLCILSFVLMGFSIIMLYISQLAASDR